MSLLMKGLSIMKKSEKSKKTNQKESIQIPIKSIEEIFQTEDQKYKIVGKVSPINGDLLSDDEVIEVFESIEAALNTFDGRIGIYILSQKINIESNLRNMEAHKETLNNDLKIDTLNNTAKYYGRLKNKSRKTLNFYIVFESSQKKYNLALNHLMDSLNNFKLEIEKSDMFLSKLSENEFKKLIYEQLNPNTSSVEEYQEDYNIYDITPRVLKRDANCKQIELDDKFYRFYSITRYPKTVKDFRWLNSIYKVNGDVNIAIILKPKDKIKVLEQLSRSSKEIGSRILPNLDEHIRINLQGQKDSAEKLIEDISNSNMSLFDVNISVGISSDNKEDLSSLEVSLKAAVSTCKCQVTKISNKGLEPLWVTLPILYECSITNNYTWNLTSADIASLIPFDSSEFMDNNGNLYGENVSSRGLIIADRYNRKKYNNGHLAIVADTGSGKTFFIMSDVIRSYPYIDWTIMFDVKGDFFFPWGERYEFTADSGICTNPFHIRSTILSSKGFSNGKADIGGAVAKKIMDSIYFISLVIDIDKFEQSLLEEDIRDSFKELGIDFESKSLPKEFPTFSTLEKVINRKIDEESRSEKEKDSRVNILRSLNPFINGVYARMFNGQTNWEYDPFTILAINNVPKILQVPLYDLLLKDTWDFARKDGTSNPESKLIVIDEAHALANTKTPQTLEFVSDELIKQGRGFGVYVTTATQNIKDYTEIGKHGEAIIDNSYFKVFFRIGENDRQKVYELYHFSKKEMKIISGKKHGSKGHGLFIAGSQRVELQVRASQEELEIIDPIQYEEIYKKKSRYRR